jgi:hypothetical protein
MPISFAAPPVPSYRRHKPSWPVSAKGIRRPGGPDTGDGPLTWGWMNNLVADRIIRLLEKYPRGTRLAREYLRARRAPTTRRRPQRCP